MIFATIVAFSMNSCGNDDDIVADPLDIIATIDGTPSYLPGSVVDIKITVTSGSLMQKIEVTPTDNGTGIAGTTETIDLGNVSGAVNKMYYFTIPENAEKGNQVNIRILAIDEVEQQETNVVFDVEGPIVSIFSDVVIEASTADGNLNSNCASIDGTVFSYTDAKDDTELQAKTDFVMVPNGSDPDDSKLVAPADVPSFINGGLDGWTIKNDTKFFASTVTQEDFDAVSIAVDAKIAELATGEEVDDVPAVAGTIFAFETVDGLKGFAKMVSYAPDGKDGQGDWNDALLTLEIKVQIAQPVAK